MDPFIVKQHDTQPSLAAQLTVDGSPIVIPGGATVRFVMRRREASGCPADGERPNVKVDAAAVVVNGATGSVRYDWATGDLDECGLFSGEFKVSVAGAVTTYPNVGYIPVNVVKDLS